MFARRERERPDQWLRVEIGLGVVAVVGMNPTRE